MKAISLSRVQKQGRNMALGLFRLLLFSVLAFVVLYPILTDVSSAFMSVEDVYDMSVRYLPKHFTLKNVRLVWERMNLNEALPNSVFIVLSVSLLQTFVSTWVGYGLAKFRFFLSKPLLLIAVLGMLIPTDLLLVPLYSIFSNFDPLGLCTLFQGETVSLINTPWSLILLAVTGTGFRCGLYILLMYQYFRGMPAELEEAAYIDGAGPIRTFFAVMLPSAKAMMLTVALFCCVWTWLDTNFTPVLLPDYPTIAGNFSTIQLIKDASGTSFGKAQLNLLVSAGSVILILPMLLLYVFTQRYFVQSVERSGLVG